MNYSLENPSDNSTLQKFNQLNYDIDKVNFLNIKPIKEDVELMKKYIDRKEIEKTR